MVPQFWRGLQIATNNNNEHHHLPVHGNMLGEKKEVSVLDLPRFCFYNGTAAEENR